MSLFHREYGVTPSLALDFINAPGSALSRLTFTRASSGTYFNSSGLLQTAATDVARFDNTPITGASALGLLIEEARTNVPLWDRDLTNAAWTATDVTVAKTATGIDGVVNSASTLTATGANGTVLQAVTLASSARFQTAWVRRRTGTGTVEMTMDNGSTWTAIVPTAAWSRLLIPTQTLANPTVGFRIVTSGDAIDVDFGQNENGTFATSSIATTTAAVTRAADVCSILTSAFPFNASEGTIVAEGLSPAGASANNCIAELNDGTQSNRILLFRTTGNAAQFQVDVATVSQAGISGGTWNVATSGKIAAAWAANDFATCFNGGAVATDTSGSIPAGLTTLVIGDSGGGNRYWNSTIRRLSYWPRRLSNTQLQALSV